MLLPPAKEGLAAIKGKSKSGTKWGFLAAHHNPHSIIRVSEVEMKHHAGEALIKRARTGLCSAGRAPR
jgi:hypothetical protein